jgi:hypothetical protein
MVVSNLSANEATVERNFNMATARVPIQMPDTYQRLPRSCKNSTANSGRYKHWARSCLATVQNEIQSWSKQNVRLHCRALFGSRL